MKMLGLILAIIFPIIVEAQTGRVSVRVTDFDTGEAVTNAEVHAGFNTVMGPGEGWGYGRPNIEKGLTDTNGICTLTGDGNGAFVSISAGKEGYYRGSTEGVHFTNVTGVVNKKYQPWNPLVDIVLKPVGNPIPMYVKNVSNQKIPARDKPVGYDLEIGDWVAPYGSGQQGDILFTYTKKPDGGVETRYGIIKTYDYALLVGFPNTGDGLLDFYKDPRKGGSALRLPKMAPDGGYAQEVTKRVFRGSDLKSHNDFREDQNYFFRVRTFLNKDGRIKSALYGKIYGGFQSDQNGYLTFTYYLNPNPNDRNLEFDPEKNLFGGRDHFAP